MHNYGHQFEKDRRLKPRFWDLDYCLLRGLANNIADFSKAYACSESRVLDYGCGAKPYRPLFPATNQYIGVDVCDNPYADFIAHPGAKLPFPDGSYDLILSTQVIYLIPDYHLYLEECYRLLKPGGFMLITAHGTWTYHPASGGDYYRFTVGGMRYILENAGFSVRSIEPIVGTLGTGLHLRQLVISSVVPLSLGLLSKVCYPRYFRY